MRMKRYRNDHIYGRLVLQQILAHELAQGGGQRTYVGVLETMNGCSQCPLKIAHGEYGIDLQRSLLA